MATYHASSKTGPKGKAASHAAYITRTGKYVGLRSEEKLEAIAHGNLPAWATLDPLRFWDASDQFERANGNAYREFELALPRELSPPQRLDLVKTFVTQELGEKHAYTFAIHNPKAALAGGEQPHVHIMFSDRKQDEIERDPEQYFRRYNAKFPEKGGCQKEQGVIGGSMSERRLARKELLVAFRERWATLTNEHLAQHGHQARVDHRSLADQGVERLPERHLGGKGVRRLKEADITALLERRKAEGELERAQAEVKATFLDLSGDIRRAREEREVREKERDRQRDYEELIDPLPEKKKGETPPASDLTLVKPPTVEAVGEEAKGRVAESLESKPLSPQPPVSREPPPGVLPSIGASAQPPAKEEKEIGKKAEKSLPPAVSVTDKKAAFWAGHAAEWGRSEEEARRELVGPPAEKPAPPTRSMEEFLASFRPDPQRERDQAEKAKQRAYDEKPLLELEGELKRLESLTKWEEVWAQLPAVVEAQKQRNEAKECYQQSVKEYEAAQHYHQTTERQERDWRKAHPVKALSHDQGLWRSPELAEREKRTLEAKAEVKEKQANRAQAKAAYDYAEAVWGSLVREPTLHKQAQQEYQKGREEARELAKAIQPRRAAQAEVEEVMKSLKVASQLHAKGVLPGVSPALVERLKHWHTLEKKDTLAFIEHKNTLKRQLSAQPELRAQLKAALAPHAHVLERHRDRDQGLSR